MKTLQEIEFELEDIHSTLNDATGQVISLIREMLDDEGGGIGGMIGSIGNCDIESMYLDEHRNPICHIIEKSKERDVPLYAWFNLEQMLCIAGMLYRLHRQVA